MAKKYFRFPVYFWEAAQSMTAKDKAAFYAAIIDYSFSGIEPTLTGTVSSFWKLAKPLVHSPQVKEEG